MTPKTDFVALLANLSPHAPTDLDLVLGDAPASTPDRPALSKPTTAPATALWTLREELNTYIGIEVKGAIKAPEALAARLGAAAVERQIIPIFLSHQSRCEMQRFGFRVELIQGATPAACQAQIEQIRRFWNLALIVSADDAVQMG